MTRNYSGEAQEEMAEYGAAALTGYHSKNANANAARKAAVAQRGYRNHVLGKIRQLRGTIAADELGARMDLRDAGPEIGRRSQCRTCNRLASRVLFRPVRQRQLPGPER